MPLTEHTGLPVAGYKSQTSDSVATVNTNKRLEEMVLRQLDRLALEEAVDKRWLQIGRTAIENGFMAVNRSVFKPGRVALPSETVGTSGG